MGWTETSKQLLKKSNEIPLVVASECGNVFYIYSWIIVKEGINPVKNYKYKIVK